MTLSVNGGRAARPRLTPQVAIGLMVVAIGVIFTLDNLGIIFAEDYVRYWPVTIVIIGAVKVWSARKDGHGWFSGLLFLGVGSYMLINRIAYIRIDPRELFPLLLVFLGGYMVWRGFFGVSRSGTASDGLNRFSAFACMGGCVRRSNSQAFEGADLTALMGGCEVDLREASIAPNTDAVIDIFAFWGGIDMKIPDDWIVINRVMPLMGGVDDKTRAPVASSTPVKRLIVRGIVIMGGVGIKNRSRRDEYRDAANLRDNIKESVRDFRDDVRQQAQAFRDDRRDS
jgi:hypothetical protein